MNYVYDFADARPTQATLAGGVAIGVARYLKKSLPNNFELTKAERDQYLSWGLGVLYNAEQTNTDIVKQPTSYFHDYGQECKELLQSWGVTSDKNVALSADLQVSSAQLPTAMSNYSAFAAAVAPYGTIGYAQIGILDLLREEGISPAGAKHWLPGAISWSTQPNGTPYPNTSAGWAAYMAYPYAGMVQMLGSNIAGTDMNYISDVTSMGFDWPAGSPYAPSTAAKDDEDDMMAWYVITADPQGNRLTYVIDHDLKSKLHLIDPDADAAIVAVTQAMPTYNTAPPGTTGPGRGFVTVAWPWSLVNSIPDVVSAATPLPIDVNVTVKQPPTTINLTTTGTSTPEES